MSADIADILTRGGAPMVALLRYCVMAVAPEAVFVLLARDYRLQPNHVRALALYDVFCARDAPARLRVPKLLPPVDMRLSSAIGPIRAQWAQLQLAEPPDPSVALAIRVPPLYLFDFLVTAVQTDPEVGFARLGNLYDPTRDPHENLPGGRMTAGQRHFVEHVWKANARARLISAGFWRIADIE